MLTLIANLGEMRTAYWMDDDYVVCPVRMIISGVLEGSEGPLYYPPSEIENSVPDWNGMPIVVYHPIQNGQNVSARNPEILEKHLLGWVFNCIYNGEECALDGEAWMSKKRLEYTDSKLEAKYQILPRIIAKIPVEVSTGLGTFNEPVTENNIDPKSGKKFTHIARYYKPDHLAVLPDREGACNVDDGCGLRTNEALDKTNEIIKVTVTNELKGDEMSKATLVKFVANNCECWKGDDATLNGFSEDKLKKLKGSVIDGKIAKYLLANRNKTAKQIVNSRVKNAEGESEVMEGVKLEDLAELFGVSINPASDPVGYVDAIRVEMEKIMSKLGGGKPAPEPPTPDNSDDDEDDDYDMLNADPDKKPTDNKDKLSPEQSHETNKDKDNKQVGNKKRKQLTDQEFIQYAPPGIRSILNNAMKQNEARKKELVEALTNNQSIDENNRNLIRPKFEKLSVEDLEVLASTIPAVNNQTQPVMHFGNPLFIGNGGSPVNPISDKEEDLMPLPWDHK